jgi:hypothetical protein
MIKTSKISENSKHIFQYMHYGINKWKKIVMSMNTYNIHFLFFHLKYLYINLSKVLLYQATEISICILIWTWKKTTFKLEREIKRRGFRRSNSIRLKQEVESFFDHEIHKICFFLMRSKVIIIPSPDRTVFHEIKSP